MLLLRDNAPAHTSGVATSTAAECGYELLPYPPYSPDLAPSEAQTSICSHCWKSTCVADGMKVTMTSFSL